MSLLTIMEEESCTCWTSAVQLVKDTGGSDRKGIGKAVKEAYRLALSFTEKSPSISCDSYKIERPI